MRRSHWSDAPGIQRKGPPRRGPRTWIAAVFSSTAGVSSRARAAPAGHAALGEQARRDGTGHGGEPGAEKVALEPVPLHTLGPRDRDRLPVAHGDDRSLREGEPRHGAEDEGG